MPALPADDRPWLTDFATIFAHMWYRDFPRHEDTQRADWTMHIGFSVRARADLMGLFTHFESGGRTDAVLKDSQGDPIAALEWENRGFHEGDEVVNKFGKLQKSCADPAHSNPRFACLMGYLLQGPSPNHMTSKAAASLVEKAKLAAALVDSYTARWTSDVPLLLVAIEYHWSPQRRIFSRMTMDQIVRRTKRRLREQPAYPWDVVGSRWATETSGQLVAT